MREALGAHASADGVRFAVLSRHAHAVWLCLCEDAEETQVAMVRDGDVWRAEVPGGEPGMCYGYRVDGPAELHFDASKLLVDPYATELDRAFVFDQRPSGTPASA